MPRNPTTAAPPDTSTGGKAAPRIKASATFTVPATKPFVMAIRTGSADESLRVRLLSIPHARHAPAKRSAPEFRRTPCPSHDRTTAPATIASAPRRSRRSRPAASHAWTGSDECDISGTPLEPRMARHHEHRVAGVSGECFRCHGSPNLSGQFNAASLPVLP